MRRARAVRLALAVAMLAGASLAQPLASGLPTTAVTVEGVRLTVEVARTSGEQFRGLGGRTWIDPQGGMLFPFGGPRETAFVMRDCPIPIDVAFLDATGRVVALHAMKPEPPRRPNESTAGYDARLTPYPSGAPVWFALETAGGRLRELGLDVGDRVEIDRTNLAPR